MSTLSETKKLSGTPLYSSHGAIFVPKSLVNTYKSNTIWKRFTILPIDSYPTDDYSTISDSWETIISNIHNGDIDNYAIGSTKKITFDGKTAYLILIGIDKDVLSSDGVSTAKTTWMFTTSIGLQKMNSSSSNADGYPATQLYTWLEDEKNKLPDIIKNNLKTVKKTYYDSTTGSTLSVDTDFWLLSKREVGLTADPVESSGAIYDQFFAEQELRVRTNSDFTYVDWWLRTAGNGTANFCNVSQPTNWNVGGSSSIRSANTTNAVIPGLCL